MEREKLAELVIQFTEAFNRDDLDGVMSFMADDAVYDEFTGTINRGAAALRGLDIIHVVNGRITEKLTYAKAKVPLLGEIA
jgi:ketosteroid isomerase-like protein